MRTRKTGTDWEQQTLASDSEDDPIVFQPVMTSDPDSGAPPLLWSGAIALATLAFLGAMLLF